MKLTRVDYLLARLARAASPLLRLLGDVETENLRAQIEAIEVRRPVFLTGLARSGTTILLQELCNAGLFATHRYRDFPFVMTPCAWNWYVGRFSAEQQPVARPHRDRIRITADSPEAFEEPIWQHFFPHVHSAEAIHLLGSETNNARFERFFREHLAKIVHLRGGGQYLSKGNYNLSRIEYLARIFPDARFVIPVRHPVAHVASLVRQHELFTGYAREDARVPRYLQAAGHYEFGPQRVPIRLNAEPGDRIADAWRQGREHAGYAIQWAEVYQHIDALRCRSELAERMLVVRHEDFCAAPRQTLESILQHVGAEQTVLSDDRAFEHISPSRQGDAVDEETREVIWSETAATAGVFGYDAPVLAEAADADATEQQAVGAAGA